MARRILAGLPLRWWNWQTHRTQNAAPKGMRVQVPPGVQNPDQRSGFLRSELNEPVRGRTVMTDRTGQHAGPRGAPSTGRTEGCSDEFPLRPFGGLILPRLFSSQKIPSRAE